MLVFIVPLQSPQASKNWGHVGRLARRTLRSLLSQDHPDFKVILVCNEPPAGLPVGPALTVLRRELPVPNMSVWENRMADKWNKVRIGLVAVRALAPCHVMVVDADDLVSRRLAAHCAAHADAVGWYFEHGWMHDENSRWIFHRRKGFHAICGTSSIVRVELADLPDCETGSREENFLLRSGHTQIRANMEARGTPLAKLPFAGSIYMLGTGENHTSFSLKGWRSKKILLQKLLSYRWLTRRVREEFGLEAALLPDG